MSAVTAAERDAFIARFGGVFEHAPWIAAAVYDAGLPVVPLTAERLHARMVAVLHAATADKKRALIAGHPDLAGRLAQAGRLTAASAEEQASAGLDRLTDGERARFTELNEAYKARFDLPFVMAVKGRTKAEIIAAFEQRLGNAPEEEFAVALAEIEKIALLRLKEMLP